MSRNTKNTKKEPQYITNYASDGKVLTGLVPRVGLSRNVRPTNFKSPMLKKPIAPGGDTEPENITQESVTNDTKLLMSHVPRMGLSRNVRPSPNGFKSPMLKQTPRYPNYSQTTPTTPLTPQAESGKDNLNDTPKEKPISRVSNRKKAKKNLQQDFKDSDGDSDKETSQSLEQIKQKLETKTTIASEFENKESSGNETSENNTETITNTVNNRSLHIDLLMKSPLVEQDPQMDDTSGRRSGRARVIRNQFVENLKNTKDELPKTKKTSKKSQKIVKTPENENIEKIVDKKQSSAEKKLRGRPKKRKISEDDEIVEPPVLKIVTPDKKESKDSPNDKECPLLSPQDVPVKKERKTRKVVRKIISDDEQEDTENKTPEKTNVVDPPNINKTNDIVVSTANEDSSDDDDDDALPLAKWSISKRSPLFSQSRDLTTKRVSLTLKRTSTNLSTASTASKAQISDENLQLEIFRNEVEALQQEVEQNLVQVNKIGTTAPKKNAVASLEALTRQWEVGCKEALIALHQKMTADGTNIDMDTLLKRFNAPEECFKFDSFEYAFV